MKFKAPAILSGLAIVAMLGPSGAFAEDVAPNQSAQEKAPVAAPAPEQSAPVSPPTKFWLEVEQSDLASLAQALNELPKRLADPLLLKLSGQLQPQAQTQIIANKEAAEKAKKGKK